METKPNDMETEFKVGDRAFDALLQEWGKVAQVNNNDDLYPILVSFNNGIHRTYTAEGKRFVSDEVHCLYHQEMAILPKDSLERVVLGALCIITG